MISTWLIRLVARLPVSVYAKLLTAFLAIVTLLIMVGAVSLGVLSKVNRHAEELVTLHRKIAAYRQLHRVQNRRKHRARLLTEKALRCRCPVRPGEEKVVHGSEAFPLARPIESSQLMATQ